MADENEELTELTPAERTKRVAGNVMQYIRDNPPQGYGGTAGVSMKDAGLAGELLDNTAEAREFIESPGMGTGAMAALGMFGIPIQEIKKGMKMAKDAARKAMRGPMSDDDISRELLARHGVTRDKLMSKWHGDDERALYDIGYPLSHWPFGYENADDLVKYFSKPSVRDEVLDLKRRNKALVRRNEVRQAESKPVDKEPALSPEERMADRMAFRQQREFDFEEALEYGEFADESPAVQRALQKAARMDSSSLADLRKTNPELADAYADAILYKDASGLNRLLN